MASGTPEALKQRVGGEVLEVQLVDPRQAAAAEAALAPMGAGPARTDGRLVTVPVHRASHAVVLAVRRLDAAGVDAADVALRRPTLDDVFLALTGRLASSDEEGGAERRVA